ncbi:MAG TPA: M23 family metallopeptidase [Pyrinomonadaceae bacterium]
MTRKAKTLLPGLMAATMILIFTPGRGVGIAAQSQPAAPPQPLEYSDIPVNIMAPITPVPVRAVDGKRYLVYHLLLTDWGFSDLTLKGVEVFDAARGTVLARYGDKELAEYYRFRSLIPTPPRSEMPNNQYPRAIASGRTGVLFFWLALGARDRVPTTLRHRFTFEANPLIKLVRDPASAAGGDMTLDRFDVAVSRDEPVVIGPPLGGGPWRCSNGPAYNTAHQYLAVRGGRVRIAQRFACDFNKVDAGGNTLPNPFPDEITNRMFYGYGAEVLAVSDGVIVFVKDGVPENVPQASGEIKPAVPLTRETISGNWVALALGGGRYAFYAHLQPGSVRVKVGDRVRAGQAIGLLGNSGNAVGPHLHFHVGDAYAVNGGDLNGNEGLPFVFDSFDAAGGTRHRREMPVNNTVMTFNPAPAAQGKARARVRARR